MGRRTIVAHSEITVHHCDGCQELKRPQDLTPLYVTVSSRAGGLRGRAEVRRREYCALCHQNKLFLVNAALNDLLGQGPDDYGL